MARYSRLEQKRSKAKEAQFSPIVCVSRTQRVRVAKQHREESGRQVACPLKDRPWWSLQLGIH